MKTINLNSLVLKNYRSYKNETVVFSQSIGLKLLGGKNNVDIKLGANGSGKSSLWDAVCWCLYGTGIKGSKISSLVSWGEKEAEVTTILSIDGVENHITRTGPPVKIKINDEVATQEQLDQLIGLPKHRFLNSVIFGQGVPLFPDLSTPERGQLLDEVLSLEIWNRCSDNATKKATQLESNLLTARINIASVQGKIEGLSTEEQIVAEIIKWDAERVSTIDNLKKQKADWKESIIKQAEVKDKDLAKLETEINAVVDILADETTGEADQIGELDSIIEVTTKQYKDAQEHFYKAKTTVDSLAESAGFWENDICPVCFFPLRNA
jgi:exonuclease SbcC